MVESKYVSHGMVAGAVSGVVMGVIAFIYMPSVEEVLGTAEHYANLSGLSEELLKGYLSIVLLVSPVIVFVFSLLLGAVFGALYGYVDKKIGLNVVLSAVITGMVFWVVVVVPNIVLGASKDKIIENSLWAGIYTITLIVLAVLRNPRVSNAEV